MSTVVLDCGTHCVGILSVDEGVFKVYYVGPEMDKAIRLIQAADEVVTYNGDRYDLKKLGEFAGLEGQLPLQGRHSDMQRICWDPILGSSLINTYHQLFAARPKVDSEAGEYEQDNESDVRMTFELWKLWKAGRLPTCRD